MSTVIFSAPQAWGKTRNARKLRAEFECKSIVDGWSPRDPIKANALHLTNEHPGSILAPVGVRIVARGWKGANS